MIFCIGTILEEDTVWEMHRADEYYWDDGISISFHLPYQLEEREAINFVKFHMHDEEREWLKCVNNKWTIDLDIFKNKYKNELSYCLNPPKQIEPGVIFIDTLLDTKLSLDILTGTINVTPKYFHKNEKQITETNIRFLITYEEIMSNKPKKIFLSHKSEDKTMVREFKNILSSLGFDTWIDEDSLNAGDKLHRSILQGFNDSCAVIFFITSNFSDERFLATEIDYAITQATERGDKFKIITLIIGDDINNIKVPKLLEQFVYKYPKTTLEALHEIIKALPITLQAPIFKD